MTHDERKYFIKADKPKYEHDCDSCVFLGQYHEYARVYDLYVCPPVKGDKFSGTVISRWSSDGPEYSSGIGFVGVNKQLTVAFEEAKRLGYLTDDHLKAHKPTHTYIFNKEVSWVIDYESDSMLPNDQIGDPIEYWWEDMRKHEIIQLIRDTYERGFEAGKMSAKDKKSESW